MNNYTVIGLDVDGNVLCRDDVTREVYNSGEDLQEFGVDNLTTDELASVNAPQPTYDYRRAPGGDGPHAFTWKDKPHRLVYDLCRWVEELRAALRPFIDSTSLHVSVTDDEMAAAIAAINMEAPPPVPIRHKV